MLADGKRLAGLALALVLASPRTWASAASREEARQSHIWTVDASDGIDAAEARKIAEAYFWEEFGDCGGPDDGVLKRRTWVFSLAFGVAGAPLKETIKVDSKTGGVWSDGGPRYRDLEAFRAGKPTAGKKK